MMTVMVLLLVVATVMILTRILIQVHQNYMMVRIMIAMEKLKIIFHQNLEIQHHLMAA